MYPGGMYPGRDVSRGDVSREGYSPGGLFSGGHTPLLRLQYWGEVAANERGLK